MLQRAKHLYLRYGSPPNLPTTTIVKNESACSF